MNRDRAIDKLDGDQPYQPPSGAQILLAVLNSLAPLDEAFPRIDDLEPDPLSLDERAPVKPRGV